MIKKLIDILIILEWLPSENFYGTLELHFENGNITFVRKIETLKESCRKRILKSCDLDDPENMKNPDLTYKEAEKILIDIEKRK